MKLVKEVNRDELATKYQHHPQFQYLRLGLERRHCYLAEIERHEYLCLLLNSSPTMPNPSVASDFPTLESVVKQIEAEPTFLHFPRYDGGLSGTRVTCKIAEVSRLGRYLDGCFIIDAESLAVLRDRTGELYIIDGMHTLVAYGLWSHLREDYFPITLHYCTDDP